MPTPPPCRSVGPQCRAVRVTLKIATSTGSPESVDHEATWLYGHTERLEFGPPVWRGDALTARARLAVPCHWAKIDGDSVACAAHGFRGRVPLVKPRDQPRQLGASRFQLIDKGRIKAIGTAPSPTRRRLPVVDAPNPCATARCRTADHRIGAACCRDLQVTVLCREGSTVDQLIRSRKSPYLCKVERETPDALGAEMISACRFLDDDGLLCSLHGLLRPDGRTAKPDLCFEWPERDDHYHAGCAFDHTKP